MAENKYSPNIIPNYEMDWDGIDPSNGLEWSGESVQKFIKSELKKKQEVSYFDPTTNVMYAFASEEDKDMWLNGGGDSYVLTQTPFNFSGTMNQIKINAEGGTNLVFTTTQEKCLLNMTFTSEQKGITDTQWEEVFEDFIVTAYVDRGAQGSFTEIGSATQVMNGKPYSIDVKKYLMTGSNRVRISVKGAITGTTANLIYNIQVTTMYLQPANFNWYTPYEEGKIDYAIGGFNIGGSINKVMKFHITNEALGYDEIFEDNIGTDLYVNRAYQWSNVPFPSTGTGVYRVEAWLDANGLESDHFVYNIMCVAEVDKDTAQLVCMNEVSTKVMNGQDNQLFGYAVFNRGASTASPVVTLEALGETIVTETLNDVTTSAKYYYNYALEVENESLSFNMDMGIALGESVASQRVVVDNSASFPAADNAVFYMNAAKRNNAQTNREVIVNEVNKSEVSVEWKNMGWKADGWTTDDEGRSCLLIPAGSQANIAYQPLGSVGNGKTIELCYKVKNVADFNENIITIATNPTSAAFQGIQIKPKRISVHSRDLKDTPSQSYPNKDEELVHVLITIVKNYKTNYGNLCQIYVNGGKRTSFDFTGTDSFAAAANIILGNNSADLYVYKMRVYNEGFEWMSAAQNFANCLPDYESKVFAWNKITAAMNDSYQVDFDQVFGKYNTMVIEMRPTPLETGGSVVYPIPNLLQPTGGLCNTWINIIDPKPGELDEDFARLFGGELIADETVEGQGTTAMTYYRWNFRWKLSKAWNKRRITAKKNVASSMHSHKMGATRLYNDMHHACVGQNELNTRVAVFQYPVYGFEKKLIEGTEDQYTYTFIGLYTIGPDKGDKTYFGFDDESVKDTLVHLEGADHTPTGVGMEYPWDECRFDFKNQCLGGINTDTTVEGAWEVGAAGDFDPEAEGDQASIQTMLNSEFKPAYKVAYDNSTYIEGVTDTLEEINADATTFKNSHSGMEVWTDGTYDLYYYHIKDKVYKPNGVNLLTQLGISESELSGKTISEKNEIFKAKRRENFRNNMGQYWHQADAIFHYAFCLMIGATDNFKKNTYPYKYYPLSEGGKWRWRQDDLDSILDINNQGFSAKSYSTLVGDLTSTGSGSVFRGDNSVFWTLIREAFPNEVADMVRSILTQMAARGSGNSSIEKCVNYVRSLFWDLAQDYFGEGSYNSDAEWTYEEAWHLRNLGEYTNDVHPLSQSLGSHYEAERDWVELRMVFLASYYNWGAFAIDNGNDTSIGQISFRAIGEKTYDITPAIDFNPTILIGQKTLTSAGGRIMAGETAQVAVSNMGSNDTHIYIQGADYYSNIGDLADLQVSADNPVFTVSSKKLRSLKLGDESADNVTSNVRALSVGDCPSLEEIDARNLPTLGTARPTEVDLTQCPRLKKALFSGTSVPNIIIPMGSKVEQLSLPDTITTLTLRGLNKLTWDKFDYGTLANLAYLRVEDNTHIDGFEMLRTAYKNSPNLANIRVIGFNVTGDATDIDMIAALATAVDENGFKIYSGIDEAGNATTTLPILDGNLIITTPVYQDTLDIVNEYYPNLKLDVPAYYVRFNDKEVERIVAENWGDGNGISLSQLKSITTINREFEGSSIKDFDDFTKFESVKKTNGSFKDSTLEKVTLPLTIEVIGPTTFQNTNIRYILIPSSVTEIGIKAFADCRYIESVVLESETPCSISYDTFSNSLIDGETGAIYVPQASLFAYREATNWLNYGANIAPYFPTGVNIIAPAIISDTLEHELILSFDQDKFLYPVTEAYWFLEGSFNTNKGNVTITPSGNITIVRSDNESCVVKANVVTEELVYEQVGVRVIFSNGEILFGVVSLLYSTTEVIMTSVSNKPLLDVCYAQGWAASPELMTKDEAEKVESISGVFKGNTEITSLNELKYFTKITSVAKTDITLPNIESVTFPPNVTSLSYGVFLNSKTIKFIDFNNVTNISNSTCLDCISLEKVIFSDDMNSLGQVPFQGCGDVSIHLPEGATKHYIKDDVLFDVATETLVCYAPNKKDETYYIPESVKTLNMSAISANKYIKHIVYQSAIYSNGHNFAYLTNLESVTFFEGSEIKGSNVFAYSGIRKIVIPDNAKVNCTFASANKLKTFITCSKVIFEGTYGNFSGCDSLDAWIIENPEPFNLGNTNIWLNSRFSSGTAFIYVPIDSLESYKNYDSKWIAVQSQIKPINVSSSLPAISSVQERDLYKIGDVYWKAENVNGVLTWVEL